MAGSRRLFLFVLALGLFAGVAPGPKGIAHAAEDAAARKARSQYDLGVRHYNVGRYREALAAFEQAYYAKPDPAFLFNLGQCYRQLKEHEAAARQYRAYLRARPDAPNRADVEQFIREADEALKKAEPPPASVEVKKPEPVPAAIATPPPATTEAPKRRTWIAGAVLGGLVVAGAAVGIGVWAATRPGDPPTDLGTLTPGGWQ